MICSANFGSSIISFKSNTVVIHYNDDMSSLGETLTTLIGSEVAITKNDSLTSTVCSSSGTEIFLDFEEAHGDLQPVTITSSSMENGQMLIYGNGQDSKGTVNGIHPVMGTFTLSMGKEISGPISADATALEIKTCLEKMTNIGSITVSKDAFGIRIGSDGTFLRQPYHQFSMFGQSLLQMTADLGVNLVIGIYVPLTLGILTLLFPIHLYC